MKIEFNINNYVEFELTAYGARILNERNQDYAEAYPNVEVFQNKPLHSEGEEMKMQLWKVMEKFGEFTTIGLDTFCKNATIVLEVENV